MKRITIVYLMAILCFLISGAKAQNAVLPTLYGLTPFGGQNNSGTILKFNTKDKSISAVKNFDYRDALGPSNNNSLLKASDGLFYSAISGGGNFNGGTIISYNPATEVYEVKYHFKTGEGSGSVGNLVEASDGKFYGLTNFGGTYGMGSLYSYDPSTSSYTSLYNFGGNASDPKIFTGGLIQSSNGKLYGLGLTGGNFSGGVIFSYDLGTNIYNNIYEFDSSNPGNGTSPTGSLLEVGTALWGVTQGGGANGNGNIFAFDRVNSTLSSYHDFGSITNDAQYANGNLTLANDGKLYGLSMSGGTTGDGTIFSIDPTNQAYSKIYDFTSQGTDNGTAPFGSLISGSDGKLYGASSFGGANNGGTVFSFNPSNATYSTLATLGATISDSKKPIGSLLEHSGKLYGISAEGSLYAQGTVFKVDLNGANLANVHSFGVNAGGWRPNGGVIKVGNVFYGLTADGGEKGMGTIFKFDPITNTYTALHHFGSIENDGIRPYASLLHASNGKLYGVTQSGGNAGSQQGSGVIFSYDIQNSTYEIIHNFGSITDDGDFNVSDLIELPNGDIYGMSEAGGTSGVGTIFSFNPAVPGSYAVKYSFGGGGGPDGDTPYGSLRFVNGLFYGNTCYGGDNNAGNLFSFDPSNNSFTNLVSLNAANGDGVYPSGTPTLGSDGNLYFTTQNGGQSDEGTIMKYSIADNSISIAHEFISSASDGYNPFGDLMLASDGKLYGMTKFGGASDLGVIFSYNSADNTYAAEADLDMTVGYGPEGSNYLFEFNPPAPSGGSAASFTTSPANIIVNVNAVYTTESGKTNYVWTIPGTIGTDYTIISGGTSSSDSTVTIKWLTPGSKTVKVNYDNSTAEASNTTTVNAPSLVASPNGSVLNENVKYSTQSGKSNYVWTIPGDTLTGYKIVSGGLSANDSTVTIKWISAGAKSVKVTYGNGALKDSASVNIVSPVLTVSPTGTLVNESATYKTQSGKTKYVWILPGDTITGYKIVSGGIGSGDSTVTIKWISAGSKTVKVTYGNAAIYDSASVTVNTPTFTSNPAASINVNTNATYTTQAGKVNYIWTVPGVLNTDYTIVSGGLGTSSNTVTLSWLTIGSKTVEVTYGNAALKAITSSTVSSAPASPAATFTLTPANQICVNSSGTYTTQSGKTNYVWTVPGTKNVDYTIVSGSLAATSNTVKLTWKTAGQKIVSVTYTNASAPALDTTTVMALPATNFSGPTAVCASKAGIVESIPVAGTGATYSWTITNGTITAGKTTNSITYTAGASGTVTLCVTVKNSTGCSSSASKSVTIN